MPVTLATSALSPRAFGSTVIAISSLSLHLQLQSSVDDKALTPDAVASDEARGKEDRQLLARTTGGLSPQSLKFIQEVLDDAPSPAHLEGSLSPQFSGDSSSGLARLGANRGVRRPRSDAVICARRTAT